MKLKDWKQQLPFKFLTTVFWFPLVEIEPLLMMHVRSIRKGNFNLFVSCLRDIIPCMFALDHLHYARRLAFHIG